MLFSFLNEVLSITAQEFFRIGQIDELRAILNEVLSITAQESDAFAQPYDFGTSSMKS